MRYLRYLGMDAHLFLMQNDLVQKHFLPENDTYCFDSWKPYIHYLDYNIKQGIFLVSPIRIRRTFKEYDILIGSGMVPIYLTKAWIKLDIFYPYAAGIEFVNAYRVMNKTTDSPLKNILGFLLRKVMIFSLKRTRLCISAGLTDDRIAFDEIGIQMKRIPVPMVFNLEEPLIQIKESRLSFLIGRIEKYDRRFICHVSHVPYKDKVPIVSGFKKYLDISGDLSAVLVFVEYGTTVDATKKLIQEAQITERVLWLPVLTRPEIIELLRIMSFGFSEFGGHMWGGTGWEFLSVGLPFFHYIEITAETFLDELGFPPPRFFNMKSPEEIGQTINKYVNDDVEYDSLKDDNQVWFNNFAGKGLGERYVEMINQLHQIKKNNV